MDGWPPAKPYSLRDMPHDPKSTRKKVLDRSRRLTRRAQRSSMDIWFHSAPSSVRLVLARWPRRSPPCGKCAVTGS